VAAIAFCFACGRFGFSGVEAPCTLDTECMDDLACNGVERCLPSNPNANERGCVAGTPLECDVGRQCDETVGSCVTDCMASADADGDGTAALECGGNDCNDGDDQINVGATEACNARDDDCDGMIDEAPASCVAATLAAGSHFACALVTGGAVVCWGENNHGQLGDGSFDHGKNCESPPRDCSTVPVGVLLPGPATMVTAGDSFACALVAQRAYCWGDDDYGQLGDGNAGSDRATPAPVTGLGDVASIAAAHNHTCAIDTAGAVWCWGDNQYGQLGYGGTSADRTAPVQAALVEPAQLLALGGDTSCATTTSNTWCWGLNDDGEIGDGTETNRFTPRSSWYSSASMLSMGSDHVCALTAGNVQCWGDDGQQQLGPGSAPGPIAVPFGTAPVGLVAGQNHTCAIDSGGAAWCWGDNSDGELGDGNTNDSPTPVQVTGTSSVSAVAGGDGFSCVIAAGTAACFGNGSFGELGDGTTDDHHTPAPVAGL
jgi:alpha-tubulin suppressor-like RCC1 family protein